VLKQQGEQLARTFNSQIFGETKITGSVRGNAIEFSFEGDAGGQVLKVSYKGVIESATAMKGAAVYAGFDDKATRSATKKKVNQMVRAAGISGRAPSAWFPPKIAFCRQKPDSAVAWPESG
jgi:hypothetical protein